MNNLPEKNRISVVINTYNAAEHLEEVLESVKLFDEIVVCDMESTDDTIAIARRHGCKIVTFPKGDAVSAEPARTFAIQSASNPWVLVVDADELVTPELREYLYRLVAEANPPQGLYIPRRNQFMGRWMRSLWPDYQLRFFVREGTTWPPYVHTFPQVNGRVDYADKRAKNTCFIHLDNDTIYKRIEKTNRYTDGEIAKRGHKRYGWGALLWRPFWRFFRIYFLKGGWRDGVPGLVSAGLTAIYQFAYVAKIIESHRKSKQTAN